MSGRRRRLRDYRELKAAHKETKPVEAEILFCAGILGHWVGDASNPLHTTIQYKRMDGAESEWVYGRCMRFMRRWSRILWRRM